MGIEEVNWGFSKCYRKSYDLKTPESNAHPAKMSMQLCFKILKKLMKDGKLKYGDTVLDFMAGIGTTAICWLYMHPSNRAITVELEPHFIKMQEGNKKYLEKKLGRKVAWEIIQGDARRLSEILKETGLIEITSPPYGEMISEQGGEPNLERIGISQEMARRYSKNPDNIGNLPDRIVGVTSPPYGEALQTEKSGIDWSKQKDRRSDKPHGQAAYEQRYSSNPKNIGNLPDRIVGITSPPYSEAQSGGGIAREGYRGKHINEMGKNQPDKVGERCGYMKDAHGKSPNNIANFPDKIVGVVSPPYNNRMDGTASREYNFTNYSGEPSNAWHTQRNQKNVGNLMDDKSRDERETYLSAMQKIYEEAAKCCSVLVTVTKNPTRRGTLRRLDIDTRKLCESTGYQTYNHVKAHLFEEIVQATLDGKAKKVPKGRLSFFKRLQYQKSDGKAEIAKWEDVLFFERDSLEEFL